MLLTLLSVEGELGHGEEKRAITNSDFFTEFYIFPQNSDS